MPPLRRAADIVRWTIQMMARVGLGGQDLLARTLARAGWAVSARAVGRYRKHKIVPPPARPPTETRRPTHTVITRFVHHVWMMDVSQVRQFLGPDLFMAAVFDAHSRVPLAVQVFDKRPHAPDMVRLLRTAVRRFARPKYLITDLGGEFIATRCRKAARRLGILQRFASKENVYATARLERFWRTLKENARLYRLGLPLTAADLEPTLAFALTHYVCFRPHEGLCGATPGEVFLGLPPACRSAGEPPRGRPAESGAKVPFRLAYLDPADHRFPILTAA